MHFEKENRFESVETAAKGAMFALFNIFMYAFDAWHSYSWKRHMEAAQSTADPELPVEYLIESR